MQGKKSIINPIKETDSSYRRYDMSDPIHQHTLYDLLRRSAVRYPHKPALIYEHRQTSYRQWLSRVDNTAQAFLDSGLVPGQTVAIYAKNSDLYATVIFAAAKSGIILVPINFMLTAEETRYILNHASVSGVIAGSEFQNLLDQAIELLPPEQILAIDHRKWLLDDNSRHSWDSLLPIALSETEGSPSSTMVNNYDVAQILYTSGTESRPKGVMLTHQNLIAEYVSVIVDGGLEPDDIALHALPFYHSAQQHVFLGPYVYLGATHVIISVPKPEVILPLIQDQHITQFFAPPTVWIGLLRDPNFDKYDLSSLKKGHYGAAIMPREILLELQHKLPNTKFWNFYGQTEVAPLATVLKPDDQLRKLGSAGKASLNVETILLDDENRPVSTGQVGEICHRSPHIMPGYWHDPEKTAEAFRGDWFHSGDLGIFDEEGYLTVVDRKKDMIKTGGENVSSREVEEFLYQLDGISEVAVIGVPDPYWIERIVAIVVPKPGSNPSPEYILERCKQHLAPYKVPKQILMASSLPKNPSGKILKRELRQQIQE